MNELKRLDEVCNLEMGQSPSSGSYNEEKKGVPFFQGNADFGDMYPKTRIWCDEPKKIVEPGTLLISVRAPIGALNFVKERSCIGRGLAGITKKESIDLKYIYYCLKYKREELNNKGTGSTFKAIAKNALGETMIKILPSDKQRECILVLDKVSAIINKHQSILLKLDDLIKARFIEMFGDPVLNPKGWKLKSLLDMGTCKNGMNFHYDDSGVELNCLGVGDFKDLSIIEDTSTLSTIFLNEMPSKEYILQDNDIVFVRSNGNKALVGRSLAVYPGDVPTTFSGFCIRYRKCDNSIIIPYLLRVLKTDSVRKKMAGRGANIQNLNQQILGTLDIPIPPMEIQNEFANFVEQIDQSKLKIQKSLEKTQILMDSLMQEYFG